MTGQSGVLKRFVPGAATVALFAAAALAEGCRSGQRPDSSATTSSKDVAPRRGGVLVASIRTEPGSFNRYVNRDSGAELVSILTQATLVRFNKATQVG